MTVILVTVDGLRPDAHPLVSCPHWNHLINHGTYTHTATSVTPSFTLPAHLSVFYGVPPLRHGTFSNEFTPMAMPLKGLIEQINAAGMTTGMVYSWGPLRDVAPPGALSYSHYRELDFSNLAESDHPTIDVAVSLIESGRLDFLFVYIRAVDEVGHARGWMTDDYLRQVEIADGQLGRVIAAMGPGDVILVESDHGGHGRGHGTDAPEDVTIPWLLMGAGVRSGVHVKTPVSLIDTAPTLVRLMNVAPAAGWEGVAIAEALEDSFASAAS